MCATIQPLMNSDADSDPTPIFVLGLQRSGTTWLANVISQHTRIAAVQSDDHFGILSSIYFSHFVPAYGDLSDEENFRRFATDFASSDYYKVSGLDPDWLMSVKSRSYSQIFRAMMDEFSRQQGGAAYWVEKSPVHTPLANELAEAYPDARFICVVRRPQAATASQLWLHGARPTARARIRALLSLSLHRAQQRLLIHFCEQRKDRCFLTQYENFVANTESETRRACEFLGLKFEPSMLQLPWRRNTSFHSMDRQKALGIFDRIVVSTARASLSVLPLPVLRVLLDWRRKDQRRRQKYIKFPDWTWHRRDTNSADSRAVTQETTETISKSDLGDPRPSD